MKFIAAVLSTGLCLCLPSVTLAASVQAVTVPLQLQEETLAPADTDPSAALIKILQLTVELLDGNVSYAQVVERQILVTVDEYQVTVERSLGAWQVTLHQKDGGSNIGYVYYGQDPKLDAALSRYLPQLHA